MKHVVITGTNRGIGLATTQKFLKEGYFVIACTRDGTLDAIKNDNLLVLKNDLLSHDDIETAAKEIASKVGNIDVLVNNAAIMLNDYSSMDIDKLKETLTVNVIGLIDFTENLIPHINSGGHIINLSSGMGSLEDTKDSNAPEYRISKTAVNMYTRTLGYRLKEKKITVSSIDPGWVKTDMGGAGAYRDPSEPANEIFELSQSNVETGNFWHAGKKVNW